MQEIYTDESTEGILLMDATNALNSLNRSTTLHSVKLTCPVLATFLHNAYQHQSRLFIDSGGEIASEEGTTQGDPLSMAIICPVNSAIDFDFACRPPGYLADLVCRRLGRRRAPEAAPELVGFHQQEWSILSV